MRSRTIAGILLGLLLGSGCSAARNEQFLRAVYEGDINRVEDALRRGADINATGHRQIPALSLALQMATAAPRLEGWVSSSSYQALAKHLIERGADVDRPDMTGRTPLYFAAHGWSLPMVRLLVENGASLDFTGPSPLVAALKQNARQTEKTSEVVLYLVLMGADVNQPDHTGDTPLYVAASQAHGTRRWMIHREFLPPERMPEIWGGPAFIDLLMEAGADVNDRDPRGARGTPLFNAAREGLIDNVRNLLAHGADPNLGPVSKAYETPLWGVIRGGAGPDEVRSEIIRLLLYHGADVELTRNPALPDEPPLSQHPLFLQALAD